MENRHILLIDGPDAKGLIHKITGVIFYRGLNVISNHEFVDTQTGHFFMRSEFTGSMVDNGLVEALQNVLTDKFQIKIITPKKKRIVVLVSKEYHCLADLLLRHEYGTFNAEILAVVSNHDFLKDLVDKFHLPFHWIPHEKKTREEHEAELMQVIDQYQPDYLVTAKYMRILTPPFVQKYWHKIVNIHHSFLPAFIGVNPYEQAYNRGVKIIGATAHYVNENLDEGPIIVQEVIPVDHKYSIEDMRQAGQDAEILALSKALKFVFEDRVFINGNKTIIFR